MTDEMPQWLAIVREKVTSLQYGVVQIVVHNSRVTQIERTERTRLEQSEGSETAARKRQRLSRPDILEVS
jgi:hypothetical protein